MDSPLSGLCKRLSDWLFSTHPTLRVRSSMAMLAVLLMASSAGVMLWLGHAGYGSLPHIRWWCAAAVGGLAIMAALVRSDITANWRDPALTFPQVLWAVTCSAVAYVLLQEQARGVVPGLLAISLFFAALNLKARHIVSVTFYALCAFTLATLITIHEQGKGWGRPLDWAYAAVLAIMLLGCMLLSLHLYQLRGRLRKQRQALALALEENRELASRDALTGLLNRRYMLEVLRLEQDRRLRAGHRMLLAQMDLDNFKAINDNHGHSVGDLALKTFADLVRSCIRNSDALSRWGGEEFVLLLSDTSIDNALRTLNRIRMAVEQTEVHADCVTLRMTVSVGLAEHLPGESIEMTLERADRALYRAKHAGRNCVVLGDHPLPAGPASMGM